MDTCRNILNKEYGLGFFGLEEEAIKGDTGGPYEIVKAMHKVKKKLSLTVSYTVTRRHPV